jgi:hypothetical protein
MKYPQPSIKNILYKLNDIEGCVVGEPFIETYDMGLHPHVKVNDPNLDKAIDGFSLISISEEFEYELSSATEPPPIILEIPPKIDFQKIDEFLSSVKGKEIEAKVKINALDALGWYFPFHYRQAQHGIYISSAGAIFLARNVFLKKRDDDPVIDFKIKCEMAIDAIRRHEAFHFAVECMSAKWELIENKACYIAATNNLKNASTYGYILEEEALANGYMLRGFRWRPNWRRKYNGYDELMKFVANSPAGYSDGIRRVNSLKYWTAIRDLTFRYYEAAYKTIVRNSSLLPYPVMFEDADNIDDSRCPLIIVDEHNIFSLLGIEPKFIHTIEDIQHSEKFDDQIMELGSHVSKKWNKTKEKLKQSTMINGLDFKPWNKSGKGYFSVRVDGNIRAHIRQNKDQGFWIAEEVGNHAAMGHG